MPDPFIQNQSINDTYGSTHGLPVHRDYNNYLNQWKFYIRSYLGGTEYKQGLYLTRYVYESENEYMNRLAQANIDNHVKSVISIYNSFLYRQNPKRDFGWMEDSPEIKAFLEDADFEGRSFDSFIRDVNIMSSIYGHCVVLVDRPETVVGTRAEELSQGIRPYVTMYTPENVLDWQFERMPNGHYELSYVKFLEQDERSYQKPDEFFVRTWTRDEIILETYQLDKKDPVVASESKPNLLGKIPAVWVYANRSPIKGIGVSDVADICQAQRFLHECYSEAEQLIRITNHPSLVKTNNVQASAGAGAIITMPEELDAGLKPYLLQPSGGNLQAILETIRETVKSIDRMAHMGAIRAIETRQMSGVAMMSEFLLLDSKLCEKAKNMELAEEQIFRAFASWSGRPFDGKIQYPTAFHIRDKNLDIDILKKAAETTRDVASASPNIKSVIDEKILEILAKDDDEMEEMQNRFADTEETHPPMVNPSQAIQHIREMIEKDGLTNEEILTLHPEFSSLFNGDSNGDISESESNT